MLNPLAQRRRTERLPRQLTTSLKSAPLLVHRQLEQSRLRSGMKNLREAGRRRRPSLLAHCHIILWSCKEQRRYVLNFRITLSTQHLSVIVECEMHAASAFTCCHIGNVYDLKVYDS